jgi:hypothetical protein
VRICSAIFFSKFESTLTEYHRFAMSDAVLRSVCRAGRYVCCACPACAWPAPLEKTGAQLDSPHAISGNARRLNAARRLIKAENQMAA